MEEAFLILHMVYFRMGDKNYIQPLTKLDKITVVLYRSGIFLTAIAICLSAFLAFKDVSGANIRNYYSGIMLLLLYFSVGLSVFFIHLYVGKFYRLLKKVYYIAVICLVLLFIAGKGDPITPLLSIPPYRALLMLPLSLCLGFVTAKEAFCFKLFEGYMLALIMPASVFLYSIGTLNQKAAVSGLVLIAAMFVFFTLRKVFMPLHYDIGDKSAYQP
ncbi:MAG: DUF2301 domain-containing membrane protein [Nitrospirota bacterium]|nr:DUF2301 domain-containing membrane protein [Nitrospirota bacterium]